MSRKALIILFVLLLVAAGAGGVYLAEELYYKPMREQKQMITNLKTMVERLTKQQRLAQIIVLEQNDQRTKFKFVEVNDKGEKLSDPQVFDIEGDVAYFDTLTIEFQGTYNPHNDLPLKGPELSNELTGHSIIFFRRVFSEKQKPEDGIPIDKTGAAPPPYRGPFPPNPLEQKLWDEFWDLATDPKLAESRGIRYASGNAAYTKLKKGNFYILEKRLTGPAIIRAEKVPAVLQE
ncbi:MAG TPA: hypothetical protein VEJ63_13170 [Planctomycetota bacterium]|nr:hypothetical protein [Planctomycetota bacterium]